VANLIPGVTFQLLAPSAVESDSSLEQIQVVISNDNSGVESTVNQFVTDYNSLMSAINTQEGYNSSVLLSRSLGLRLFRCCSSSFWEA